MFSTNILYFNISHILYNKKLKFLIFGGPTQDLTIK